MKLLTEVKNVQQVKGEHKRRWFSSDDFDLIVWSDESGSPLSFQLCYDRQEKEKSISWKKEAGITTAGIDDGEGTGFIAKPKASPIQRGKGQNNDDKLLKEFTSAASELPYIIVSFVLSKIS